MNSQYIEKRGIRQVALLVRVLIEQPHTLTALLSLCRKEKN